MKALNWRSESQSWAWAAGFASLVLLSSCNVTVGQQTFLPKRTAILPLMPEAVTRTNIELVVEPGLTLRGWRLHREGSRRVVVFFHGNGAGILSSDWGLHWLASALNADVIAFDDRGYGFSDGQASIDPIIADSLRIGAYLHDVGLDTRPLVIVGQSMGTAPAMHLAAAKPAAGLVLISPFSSYRDLVAVVRKQVPWYAHVTVDASLTELAASPLADLPKIGAPTLIIHGTEDELSTDEVVSRVQAASGATTKVVCKFPGTHSDANPTTPEVRACIERFVPHFAEK